MHILQRVEASFATVIPLLLSMSFNHFLLLKGLLEVRVAIAAAGAVGGTGGLMAGGEASLVRWWLVMEVHVVIVGGFLRWSWDRIAGVSRQYGCHGCCLAEHRILVRRLTFSLSI